MNFHVKYFDKLRPTLTNLDTLSLRVTRTVASVVQCGVLGIYSWLGLSHWMNCVFWIIGLGPPWGKTECPDDMHGTTSVWTSQLLFLSGYLSVPPWGYICWVSGCFPMWRKPHVCSPILLVERCHINKVEKRVFLVRKATIKREKRRVKIQSRISQFCLNKTTIADLLTIGSGWFWRVRNTWFFIFTVRVIESRYEQRDICVALK